jgi:hypothetical protein
MSRENRIPAVFSAGGAEVFSWGRKGPESVPLIQALKGRQKNRPSNFCRPFGPQSNRIQRAMTRHPIGRMRREVLRLHSQARCAQDDRKRKGWAKNFSPLRQKKGRKKRRPYGNRVRNRGRARANFAHGGVSEFVAKMVPYRRAKGRLRQSKSQCGLFAKVKQRFIQS